jgi:NAD(P)-dependent dehydrogenase (short-subunit alcohol dehydrogenase family)
VVIVTGGASGIGLAVADRLLAEGSSVVLVDVDEQGVRETIDDRVSDRLLGVVADVSTEEGTESYFAATLGRFGRVDGLHANAGIAEPGPSIADAEPGDFDRMIAVNLRGVFLAIRLMLRTLAAQGTRGSIVTTASVLGLRGFAGSGSYCASKAGVISLTRTAALEAGPDGHRVNAVLPGPIETPMAARIEESLPESEREQFRNALRGLVPLGRYGHAAEVAALVAWLLSDESSYVTGGAFSVDGGQAAG